MARLDEALKELTGREGDARAEIFNYLRAEQTVGAKRAFLVGEALAIAASNGQVASFALL